MAVPPPTSWALGVSVALGVTLVVFANPIGSALLDATRGSLDPAPFTSLALADPAVAARTLTPGEPLAVDITNHTGGTARYTIVATAEPQPRRLAAGTSTRDEPLPLLDRNVIVRDGGRRRVVIPTEGTVPGDWVVVTLADRPQRLQVPVGERP